MRSYTGATEDAASGRAARPGGTASFRQALLLEPERVVRACAGRHDDALGLEVEVERLDAELASEAGLLVAAERDTWEGGVGHVDSNRAGLRRWYGPTLKAFAALEGSAQDALEADLIALARRDRLGTDAIAIPATYTEAVARKR